MEIMKRKEVATYIRKSVEFVEQKVREDGCPLSRYMQDGPRGTRFWKKSDVDEYLASIYNGAA